MSAQPTHLRRRPHVPWWVACAWGSLVLVVLGGLCAAAGLL